MMNQDLGVFVAVISTKRPDNVARMNELIGPATWYVGDGEEAAYAENGAPMVVSSGGLCESRNAALEAAFKLGAPCVQVSDDLRKLQFAMGPKSVADTNFASVVEVLLATCEACDAKLAGVAPTANAFYFNPKSPIKLRAFIVGDLVLLLPSTPRWDERLKLKEDYDMTLQHLKEYQCVVRCDAILATFLHRTNKGGAVEYRTAEREQEAIAHLKSKWGTAVRDNPRRPNEILLSL